MLYSDVMQLLSFVRAALVVGISGTLALGCAPESDEEELAAQDAELSTNEVVDANVRLRINADRINMRAGAGTEHAVVTVLDRGQIVTSVERSGGNGWVKVKTAENEIGWVINKYLERVGAASTATCAVDRGRGVAGRFQKALHDSIAFAEGTEDHSKDGYDVMFSFKIMSHCRTHPNQCHRFGGSNCSTAAGRYQILKDTWDMAKNARNLTSFEPENQERAAMYLITNIRGVTVPQSRAMTASEFSNAMSKLSWEWASLPPGRHGQPNKTQTQMRRDYCQNAGC